MGKVSGSKNWEIVFSKREIGSQNLHVKRTLYNKFLTDSLLVNTDRRR
ncbi:hypothetical protein ACFL0Z_00670 [Patescibacteria group bacterium]